MIRHVTATDERIPK